MQVEPLFVNRRSQLQLFDDVLAGLAQGARRHVALLGLRRIGKTMLLDEVRARHREFCIPRLPVDTTVSTPEDFALEFVATVLQEAANVRGLRRHVTTQPENLTATAALLDEGLVPHVEEIVHLVSNERNYSRLLNRVFGFPGAISRVLDLPILIVLDEFQAIRRLLNFPGTDTLWGAIREALDLRGKVAFVVAGSIITAMREILHAGNEPLFTRFHELELPPFDQSDTAELASRLWEQSGLKWSQNGTQRIHAISQGFPFYAHVLSLAAIGEARPGGSYVDEVHVDAAFQSMVLDRNSAISIYCQYLFERAIEDVRGESIPDAILRHLAGHEGMRRVDLARALRRSRLQAQVNRVVAELIDIDILVDVEGGLWFVDPILPIWVALERERRSPRDVLQNPQARAKVIRSHGERLRALQDALGDMFEKRIHNLIRQFRGQTVSGRLFGVDGQLTLPTIDDVANVELPDSGGVVFGKPGSVELDGVTEGSEVWALEAKYRAGGITAAQVDRFQSVCQFFESTGRGLDKRWYVSQTGFRVEGRTRCQELSILFSTLRDVAQLERIVARREPADS